MVCWSQIYETLNFGVNMIWKAVWKSLMVMVFRRGQKSQKRVVPFFNWIIGLSTDAAAVCMMMLVFFLSLHRAPQWDFSTTSHDLYRRRFFFAARSPIFFKTFAPFQCPNKYSWDHTFSKHTSWEAWTVDICRTVDVGHVVKEFYVDPPSPRQRA